MSAIPHMVLGLSMLLSGAAQAADAASESKALHGVVQSWTKAYNAGDAEGIAALYAEDALLMPLHQPAVSGRAAIHAYFTKEVAEAKKGGMVVSTNANPDSGATGDLGWASGTYAVKDKSGRTLEAGKYLSVFKKKDSKWLFLRDTWNTDSAPVAAPKKD